MDQTLGPLLSFALLILGIGFLENCIMIIENVKLLYKTMFTGRLATTYWWVLGDFSYVKNSSKITLTCFYVLHTTITHGYVFTQYKKSKQLKNVYPYLLLFFQDHHWHFIEKQNHPIQVHSVTLWSKTTCISRGITPHAFYFSYNKIGHDYKSCKMWDVRIRYLFYKRVIIHLRLDTLYFVVVIFVILGVIK